jgi:opacity protein-like surface antigen
MSIKNTIVLAAAGLAVAGTSAFAGGGMCPTPVNRTGVYVEGNIGVVWKNYGKHSTFGNGTISYVDHNTALALGGDVGYMWTNYLGLEFGGFWFQSSKINAAGTAAHPLYVVNSELKTWAAYLAAKLMVPVGMVNDNLYAFAKAGVGYQHTEGTLGFAPHFGTNGKAHSWVPAFAVGMDYFMNSNLMLNLQYMYFGDAYHLAVAPAVIGHSTHKSILTVGVGYRFSM